MPELPDVESFRKFASDQLLGRRIKSVEVPAPRILDHISPQEISAVLTGREFASALRHGKNLLLGISDGGPLLTVHFGLSGYLRLFDDQRQDTPHVRFRIDFADGKRLVYDNQRMIGRIGLTENLQSFLAEKNLGPDALSIDEGAFVSALSGKHKNIKSLLMDQNIAAGVGNEYSDEILFHERIHPSTPADFLDEERLKKIYRRMEDVLAAAVRVDARHERLPASFLLPARHRGGACPRCGARLATLKFSGRTGYFCPACQH